MIRASMWLSISWGGMAIPVPTSTARGSGMPFLLGAQGRRPGPGRDTGGSRTDGLYALRLSGRPGHRLAAVVADARPDGQPVLVQAGDVEDGQVAALGEAVEGGGMA